MLSTFRQANAAVVKTLACEFYELVDVLRGFVGCELEAEDPGAGGHDRFKVRWRLRKRRDGERRQ
jgi:hypothetical protein